MDLDKKIKKIKKENTYRSKAMDFEGYVKTSLEIEEFYEKNKDVIIKDKGKLKRRLDYLNLKINKKRNIKENITYAIILGIIVFIFVKCTETFNNYLTNDLPKTIQDYDEINEKFNEFLNNPEYINNTEYINKESIEEMGNLLLKLNKLINFLKLFTYFGIIYFSIAKIITEKLLDRIFIDDSFYGQKLMLKELNIIDSLLCQIFISEQNDNSSGSRDKRDCCLEFAEKYKNEINK